MLAEATTDVEDGNYIILLIFAGTYKRQIVKLGFDTQEHRNAEWNNLINLLTGSA
jgi:hypothetical protein